MRPAKNHHSKGRDLRGRDRVAIATFDRSLVDEGQQTNYFLELPEAAETMRITSLHMFDAIRSKLSRSELRSFSFGTVELCHACIRRSFVSAWWAKSRRPCLITRRSSRRSRRSHPGWGVSPEAVRRLCRQDEISAGLRPRVRSDEHCEIACLKRENAKLRRVNEVLNAA